MHNRELSLIYNFYFRDFSMWWVFNEMQGKIVSGFGSVNGFTACLQLQQNRTEQNRTV
jgi:hypothetical protein